MERPLIVFDTETATCRGAPHLLELGAVRVVDGEVADHFESLVRPEVPIDPETSDVHGIEDDDVRDAPDAGAAVRAFVDWAGDDWLAAHDVAFDARVLAFEARRYGIDVPSGPVLDSLPIARVHLADAPDYKLPTLADWLGLEVDTHHRALADAVTCWKVLEACIERLDLPHGQGALGQLLASSKRPRTISNWAPGPPRKFPRRLRPIETALADGENVVLLYGAEEPAQLGVRPRMLYRDGANDYLEGECESSGLLKTYRLDRIQRVLPAGAES